MVVVIVVTVVVIVVMLGFAIVQIPKIFHSGGNVLGYIINSFEVI